MERSELQKLMNNSFIEKEIKINTTAYRKINCSCKPTNDNPSGFNSRFVLAKLDA